MTLLAHGGGLPETLSVLVPIAAAWVLVRSGKKARGEETKEDRKDDPPAPDA